MTSQLAAGAAPFVPPPPANDTAAAEPTPPEPRATSTADESSRDRDGLLLLLAVSIIAFAALCWWLEHLAFLLKPLVFAVALSLGCMELKPTLLKFDVVEERGSAS